MRTRTNGGLSNGRWVLVASFALLALSTPVANRSRADDEEGLREGWQWQVTLPAVSLDGKPYCREARVRLWVEMGWLMLRRTSAEGDFEWQLVLARASDPRRPEIKIDEEAGSLDINYRGYFIREAPNGKFRIYREIKSADSPEWPLRELEGRVEQFGGGDVKDKSVSVDGWRFLSIGPTLERPEFWFRFQPRRWSQRLVGRDVDRSQGNFISSYSRGAPPELFSRNELLRPGGYDVITLEKDLLIGSRVTLDQAARGVSGKTLSDALLSLDAPTLAAGSWLNAEPPVIESLKGQVVLVGFWSAGNAPSVEHLARLEALQKKYKERGLVTLGIHPQERTDDVARLLKERGVTFPVGIDAPVAGVARGAPGSLRFDGETAKRFYVQDHPCYFLIDRAGKIDLGLGMEPPTEPEIEKLLLQDGIAPPLDVKEWLNSSPLALEELRDRVVVLAFLDGALLRSTPASRPIVRMRNEAIKALREKFEPRGVLVIGVYLARPLANDPAGDLARHGINYPVVIDAGETAKRYGIDGFGRGTFLIGKGGRLRGGERNAVPSDAEIEELLK